MESDSPDLRTWRKHKGISLDAIAASTKLSVRQLEAIEAGDFSKLPGGIYNTNYIRQYARAIGFDEAALLAFYHGRDKDSASSVRTPRPFWQLAR